MRLAVLVAVAAAVVGALTALGAQAPQAGAAAPPLNLFFTAASTDERAARQALDQIAAQWHDGYTPMFVDLARLMRPAPRQRLGTDISDAPGGDDPDEMLDRPRSSGFDELAAPVRRESIVRRRLTRFLEDRTRQRFGDDLGRWREWMWSRPADPHPDYAAFKGFVYAQIDPIMRRFFPPGAPALIRLDEIDWGGVRVNGIPPLDHPAVVPASAASYLRDGDIVFGVAVNGESRAYPKRILAWHEMALDRIGGTEMTIVYCTLCGTVIPYESAAGGRPHRFGTSGLLYRSNKLMFDEATVSLWSTLEGRPVVGALVGSGLQLVAHAAVTTTWGEWRRDHPDTTVLSLETGFDRDYREGAAYRDYFSNDNLYFSVPRLDRRLKNKAEVVVFTIPAGASERQAVAISADFLERHPVYEFVHDTLRYVIVTSPDGANRVYDARGVATRFATRTRSNVITDADRGRWTVTEAGLVRDSDGTTLPRISAQRAFWFGWFAQFPDTLLIK